MIPIVPRRVIIAQHRIDYRKQWNGFLGECYLMGFNPYEGDCVVFLKRDRTQLRALSGDQLGLILIARRFDGGRLQLAWLFQTQPTFVEISLAELALLFEGASYTVYRRVRNWK